MSMARITVKVTETLERTVVFMDVANTEAALDITQKMYKNEDIVLDSGDFLNVEFTVSGECGEVMNDA